MPSLARLFFLVLACALFASPSVSSALLDEADKVCRAPTKYESYDNKNIFFPNTFQKREGGQIITVRSLYQMPCEDTTGGKVAVKGKCEAQNVCAGKMCLTTTGTYEVCKKTEQEVKETPNTGPLQQTNTPAPQQNTGVQAPVNPSTDPRLLDVPSLQDPDSLLPSGSSQNVEAQLKSAAGDDGIWGDVAKWFAGEEKATNIPISDVPGFDGNQIQNLTPEHSNTSFTPEDWVGPGVTAENTFTNTNTGGMEPDSFWSDAKAVTQAVKETAQDAYDAVRSAFDASPFQEPVAPPDIYTSSNYDDLNNLGTQTFKQMRDEIALQNQNLRDALDSQSELEDAYITAQNRIKAAAQAAGAEIKDGRYVVPANTSVGALNELNAALGDAKVKADALNKVIGDSRETVLAYNTAATNYKNVLNDPVARAFAQKILQYETALSAAQPAYDAWQANTLSANLSPEDYLSGAPPPDYILASTRLNDANRAFDEYMSGNHSPALQQRMEEAKLGQGTGSAWFDYLASPFKANAVDTADRIKTDWEAIKSGTLLSPVHATFIAGNSAFWLYHAAVGGVIDSTKTVLEGLGVPGFRDTPEGVFAAYADPGARAERMALATVDVVTVATPFGRLAGAVERTVLGAERGFEAAAVTTNINAFRPAFTSELDNFGARAAGAYVKEEQLMFAQSLNRGVAPEVAQASAYQNLYQNLGRIDIAQTPRGEQILGALRREMDDLGIAVPTQNVPASNVARSFSQAETPFQPPAVQANANVMRQAEIPSAQPAVVPAQQVVSTVDDALLARYVQENTAPLTSAKAAPLAEEVSVIQNYNNALNYSKDVAQKPTGVARLDALNTDKAITWRTEAAQALQERGLGVRLAANSDANAVDAIYRLDTREVIAQRPVPRGGTEYDTLYEVVGTAPRVQQVASINDTPVLSNVRPVPLTDTPVTQTVANPFRFGDAPRVASQIDTLPRFAPEVAVAERPFLDPLSNVFSINRLQTAPVPAPITQTQIQTIERYVAVDNRLRDLQRGGLTDSSPVVRSYTNLKFDAANELWRDGFVFESATGNILKDNVVVAAKTPLEVPGQSAYVILAKVEPSTFAVAPEGVSPVSQVSPTVSATAPVAPPALSPIQRIVEPIRRAAVTTGLVTGLAFTPTHVEGAIATQLMERSLPLSKITSTQVQTGVKSELEQLLTQLEPKVELAEASGQVPVQISGAQRLLNTINSALVNLRLPPGAGELYVHKITIETADLNPNLTSWAGARGIGQVTTMAVNELKSPRTPAFIKDFLTQKYGTIDNAWQLVLKGGADGGIASVDLGMAYVGYLYHVLGYRGEAIIAGYNGGPGGATRLINAPRDARGLHTLGNLVWETRNYVETIRGNIARVRDGLPPRDQSGGLKTGTALTEFLTLYRPQLASIPAPDLRVSTGPRFNESRALAQAPALPPVQALDLPPLNLNTVVRAEFPPVQTAEVSPLNVTDVVGSFDAPVIARQGPIFTVDTMPTNWNPANLLAAEKVTPGPVELPPLQIVDLQPPTVSSQQVAANLDSSGLAATKTQIETQLSQAQSDLASLQARIARAQNVQNGMVNAQTARVGLDTLESLWLGPNEQQKGILVRGTNAAAQLGKIVTELGNSQLGSQVNAYVGTLRALLQPANQTLANKNRAVAQGNALLQQTSSYLTSTAATVDRNIAALRTQEAQLKSQVQELNTSLAQVQTQEQQIVAQANIPQNASAPVESIRPVDIETPVVLEAQPVVTAQMSPSSVTGQTPAPNQFQVAYQQFKDYWGPVRVQAFLSPLAPGVPLTPTTIGRALRPRDPEVESGDSAGVPDTSAGAADADLEAAFADLNTALRDVEDALVDLQAKVSGLVPEAVVEDLTVQLATNISAVDATASFLQPISPNSPIKMFAVVPESHFDSFVLAPTPGTVRLYRGLGQDYSPNYGGPDPFFAPNDYVALEYARGNAFFDEDARLLIVDLDERVWADMQAYRQVQSSLRERLIGLGELSSGFMQLPKDWLNPATTKFSLVDDISGLGERYAREIESITEEGSNVWRQRRAEEDRIAQDFRNANPGQDFWSSSNRKTRMELFRQDEGYVAAAQRFDTLVAQKENAQKAFAEKFAAERALRQGMVPTETGSMLSLPAPTGERNFVFTGPTWNPTPNINRAVTPDVIILSEPVELPVWHRELPNLSTAAEQNALARLDSLSGVGEPIVTPIVEAISRVPVREEIATGVAGVKSEFSSATGVTTYYDTVDGTPFMQQKSGDAPILVRANGAPVQTSRLESTGWIYDTALILDRADKFDLFEEALIGQGWKIRDMHLLDDVTVQGTNVFGQSVTLSRDVVEGVRAVGLGVYDLDAMVSRINNHTGGHVEINGIKEFPSPEQYLFSHEHGWVHPYQLSLNTVRTQARLMEILTVEIEKYPSAFWDTVGYSKIYTYDYKAGSVGLTNMVLGLGSRGQVPEMWLLPVDSPSSMSMAATFHHELQHVVDRFFPADDVWATTMDYANTQSWRSSALAWLDIAPRGYARGYGYRGGAVEDKATLVELMFHDYPALSQRAANDPVLAKKINAAKEVFSELSNGQMNDAYWANLRPMSEQNVLIATESGNVAVPSVRVPSRVETPFEESQSYKEWSEFAIAASDSSLFALDSLSGVRGPTVVPTFDMRLVVPRVAEVPAPVLTPTTNAVQLELPFGNTPQPARQLEFDFGQNNTSGSTVGAVQGELPLSGNLGQQLELPFNTQPVVPATGVQQAVPAPAAPAGNVPTGTSAPQPVAGTNYTFNPATNGVAEIPTPLPGGGAGAGGTPPPNTGASGAADADAGGSSGTWRRAAAGTIKFLCWNGYVRMAVCGMAGVSIASQPFTSNQNTPTTKANTPSPTPRQNTPPNQPSTKSDANNPSQQAVPPAGPQKQDVPTPDPTKQQPTDSLAGKVFDQPYYCIKSIEPVVVITVPAGTAFPTGCYNGSHPSAGQVFDKPYYCISSVQPIIVKTVPAGTPFPANCYNGPNAQTPPPYVPPPSGPAAPVAQQSPSGSTSGATQSPLMKMFSNLFGQYLGQQLQNQQQQTQSQQSTPTTQPAPSTPKATVAVVANPSSVKSGGTSVLWWASVRTSECIAYAPDGTQIGSAEESGTAEASNITQTSTYSVKCKGVNGENVSASVQIAVAP